MKNWNLALAGLVSFLSLAAQAGPGAGGGTVVVIGPGDASTDVLVDFLPGQNEIAINPRTFEGIYQRLKPRLERLNYYYPDFQDELEAVFKKQWKMTTQRFRSGSRELAVPIVQTEDFVKITYDWFKDATDVQKEQAWLHEMVRRYVEYQGTLATGLRRSLKDDPRFLASIDKIIFTLTPLFYNEEPFDRVSLEWTHAIRENLTDAYVNPILREDESKMQVDYYPGDRSMMYHTIALGKLGERYAEFCQPEIVGNPYRLRELIQEFPRLRDRFYSQDFLRLHSSRSEMLDSYIGISSAWQIRSVNLKNIYNSDLMHQVSMFALRTTAAMEGVPTTGSWEFLEQRGKSRRDKNLTVGERMEVLKATCRVNGPGLAKALAEYERDGGKVRQQSKSQPDANEDQVRDFFRRRGR